MLERVGSLPLNRSRPKKKKDQLALVQSPFNYFTIGPVPTTPGGWGLRNPVSKEPGQRK